MKSQFRNLAMSWAAAALLFAVAAPSGKAQTPAPAAAPALEAKITSKLNTKNAKVGDTVTAKTLTVWKLADGTEIPKGSKLIAKVTSVQSKQAGNGNSMLTFRFDEAEAKGGAAIPIKAIVVAVGPSMAPEPGLGANSVLARSASVNSGGVIGNPGSGTGQTNGIDPSTGLGKPGAKNEDDIPMGSTLEGVALGRHLDADWTTAMQGVRRDIQLDSDVFIKVQFM